MKEYDSPEIGFIAFSTSVSFGFWMHSIAAGAFMLGAIFTISLIVTWVVIAIKDETE